MLDHVRSFILSLLPWQPTFDATAVLLVVAYGAAQALFCLLLRRNAMAIPGPTRMCSPLGLWILVIPGAGAIGSFGVLRHVWDAATAATSAHHIPPPRTVARRFAILYGVGRLLIFVPGLLIPSVALQAAAATGFLLQLTSVARSLRTPDVAVA